MWYTTIKDYYNRGFYTAEQVQIFLNAGWITQEEYNSIINQGEQPTA